MKATTFTLLIFLSLHFSGCTAVTKYTYYKFDEDRSNKEERPDGIWVYVPIKANKTVKTIIPVLYDNEISKEPYSYFFTIWGNFKKINSVDAYFLLNKKTKINILADVGKMNDKRKNGDTNDRYLFPAGGYELKLKWNDVEHLELVTHFTATDKKGAIKKYDIKNTYLKKINETTGNRVWSALMSV